MSWGYMGEQDLFFARAVLEMLCREDSLHLPRKLKKKLHEEFPHIKSSILNYLDILMDAIEISDLELAK